MDSVINFTPNSVRLETAPTDGVQIFSGFTISVPTGGRISELLSLTIGDVWQYRAAATTPVPDDVWEQLQKFL